jgi:hypothetical protein
LRVSQKLTVEINETDRHCIATILKIDLYEESHYYLNEIREYGFTHIIIVGRLLYGIFLDCYGHVFKLDMMSGVLWPVGNSLAKAATKPWTDEVAWDVNEDDGTVFKSTVCMQVVIIFFIIILFNFLFSSN